MLGERSPGLSATSLVADSYGADGVHGFRKIPTDGAQYEGWDLPLGHQGQVCGLARKFAAAIEFQTRFAKEFGGEAHVLGAIYTPEPQFFFVALQKVQALFQLLHAPIKRGSQKKDAKRPGVAWVSCLNADTILTRLVAFHTAAIFVPNN
jgi:hypothetical protein